MNEIYKYDDLTLLQKVNENDEKAFNILFERYRNQMFNYLFKITKSKETAEEMVLDVFLKIWLGREIITGIRNFERFLFRIAHNKAIDFLRNAQRHPLERKQVWDLLTQVTAEHAADDILLRHRAEQSLHEAIQQLPPQRQKVFQLSREEGLSYDQIAGKLKLSRNTVRNHLSAALDFIRNYLHGKGYEINSY